jgi:hypothetical protein
MEAAGTPPHRPARADRGWAWAELDLPNVLWFFGTIVAAGASIAIVDKIPESHRDAWELVASLSFMAAYALAAVILLRKSWRIPGGLAATAATAMVPAVAYGFTQLIGVYPDDPFFSPISNYSGALFAVGCVTAVAGIVVYALTRFSFVLLIATGAVQMSGQLLAPAWKASGDGRAMTAIVLGAVLVVVGLLADARGLRREGFWCHAVGLFGIAAALAYFAVASTDKEGQAWLPMLIAGAFVLLAAALLRRRVFATYGAAGLAAALSHYLGAKGDWFAYFLLGLALVVFVAGLLVYPAVRRAVEVRSEPL